MSVVRRHTADKSANKAKDENVRKVDKANENTSENMKLGDPMKIKPNTYWLTRIILLRYLAFIYGMYFYQFCAISKHNISVFMLNVNNVIRKPSISLTICLSVMCCSGRICRRSASEPSSARQERIATCRQVFK